MTLPVLPAASRMRRSSDFAVVVPRGRRVRSGALVVHHLSDLGAVDAPAAVGFVVGRSVGGSVVRHRVSRRLREQVRLRLDRLPAGSGTVVRALPPAAGATSSRLGADLERALDRVLTQ